jgi:cation:H+ antiporter
MGVSVLLVLVSFAVILGGALLFTNAVEWLGIRLHLGHGAVGSVLAAVATAMPESVIPVVAIISGDEEGSVAIGAILGAPFLLGTLGMAVVGIAALVYRRRRTEGTRLRLDQRATRRDLVVFLPVMTVVLVLGLLGQHVVNVVAAVALVLVYGVYAWRTIAKGGGAEEEPKALLFDRRKGDDAPRTIAIAAQVFAGIAMIVGGAHLFVTEVEHVSAALAVSALVLALVLAPLASELPEKLNSVLWVRQGKDSLALGNITGAMVFQSTIPVAVGLAFTSWRLPGPAVVACVGALLGGILCLLTVSRSATFSWRRIVPWAVLYLGGVGYTLFIG